MSTFLRFFVANPKLANLFTLLVILAGIGTLSTIKRDTFPSVDFGEVLIKTRFPGASPEEVELRVSKLIETQIQGISGIESIRSWSIENYSVVGVVLDPDEPDQDEIKTKIRETVNSITDLPAELLEKPTIQDLNTSIFPVIEVGLTGDVPYRELQQYAKYFEKLLKDIDGVSNIDRYGFRAREVSIVVDPEKLNQYQLPIENIIGAIQKRNVRSSGGSFESYTSSQNIVTLAEFASPQELNEVIVRTGFSGPAVRMKDVSIIKDDFEEAQQFARMNGKKTISFVISKTESADIVGTVDAVKKLIENESKSLPDGMKLEYSHDGSKYVKNRFSIVSVNGAIGLILLFTVLAFFLQIRVAFWVAMGVPIAMLGTIFLLPIFDVYLDSITLTAMILVTGIVVDDAIVVAENIYRHYESGKSPIDAAVDGLQEVIKPVITTIATTIVAFLPMFFMPGNLGMFVFVIPLTVTLALIVSFLEVFIALPSHLAQGFSEVKAKTKTSKNEEGFKKIAEKYENWLIGVLKKRYLVISIFIGVLMVSLFFASQKMDFVLFPPDDAQDVQIFIELESGSSLQATSDKLVEFEKILEELPKNELSSYVTRIGSQGDLVLSENENAAFIKVALTPFNKRKRDANEIVDSLRQRFESIQGVREYYFEVDNGGPNVGDAVDVIISGGNNEIRVRLADDIEKFLSQQKGVRDLSRDDVRGKNELRLKLDYDMLARSQLTVADVSRNVRIAYDGEVVTSVTYDDEEVDFRVIYPAYIRENADALNQLLVANANGKILRLGQVAEFETAPGPANVSRYKGSRSIEITGDIDPEKTTSLEATNAMLAHFGDLKDYPGMRISVDGQAQESQKSFNSLMLIFGIAVIGVYGLLMLLFDSLAQPALVLVTLPFAVIGVIIALAAHGKPFSFLAILGIVGLIGIVVNDSLILVNHINDLIKKQKIEKGLAYLSGESVLALVAKGSSDRLRAIILTSVTTVAGLMPLAYGIGGADAYMTPMALSLGYGLLLATPLTLILVPSLYLFGEDLQRIFKRTS